jgi:hypothetical protein
MQWVRARLKLGSYLALLALAFQLVVSFGHVHLEDIGAQSPTTIAASDNTAPLPAGHDRHDGADHYCAICALMHLAGAATVAEPPSVPLPPVFAQWRPDPAVKFGWFSPPHAFFFARAPPLA